MISVTLLDENDAVLFSSVHENEAMLCYDRILLPGDKLRIASDTKPAHFRVNVDNGIPDGEIYAPEGCFTWPIPAGEHRLAYCPGIFEKLRHTVSVRIMSREEILTIRDVARCPLDLRGDTDFYPHCTANVETRGESCFAARNVIDGLRFNTFHGEWPFESWGIGAREDAFLDLYLGREILTDTIALTLRADFPHDAWWTSASVLLSDGAVITFPLQKTGNRQIISLRGTHRIRTLRLFNMIKSYDPSAFPSLRSLEVYGKDID